MKSQAIFRFLIGAVIAANWLPASHAKGASVSACAVRVAVIQKDTLGNIQDGLQGKSLKWMQASLAKKYPEICYAAPKEPATAVLLILATPATYHGTRVVSTASTTSGKVTDDDGSGSASYQGTTYSSAVVPQTFDYSKFTLSVETMTPDQQIVTRHRFQQDGVYNTYMGIPLGGRGHHPQQALIEDAVKWIHDGGLNDPLQTAQ